MAGISCMCVAPPWALDVCLPKQKQPKFFRRPDQSGSSGLVPLNALVVTLLPDGRQSGNYPETGFEEVGRIGTGKSASRKLSTYALPGRQSALPHATSGAFVIPA